MENKDMEEIDWASWEEQWKKSILDMYMGMGTEELWKWIYGDNVVYSDERESKERLRKYPNYGKRM